MLGQGESQMLPRWDFCGLEMLLPRWLPPGEALKR
jgi:hypothetical protein